MFALALGQSVHVLGLRWTNARAAHARSVVIWANYEKENNEHAAPASRRRPSV